MNKNLVLAINYIYPDLVPFEDFRVVEENGVQEVADWHASVPQPTDAELDDTWQKVIGKIRNDEFEAAVVAKQQELNDCCEADIVAGYDYTLSGVQLHFGFDKDAQFNFLAALDLLGDGTVDTTPWTAYLPNGNRVRVNLKLEDLKGMRLAQFNHKNDIIGKYNDLLINQVYKATTKDEVEAIKWS